MTMRVYLAGAVELVSREHAEQWRDKVRRLAEQYTEWQPVDPLTYEEDGADANQIFNLDRHLLLSCGAVLLDARQPGWGTGTELSWAHEANIPVIAWGVDREAAPTFLRVQATIIEKNLGDAVLRVGEVGP